MGTSIRLPVFQTIEDAWHKVKGVKATFFAVACVYIALQLVNAFINKFVLVQTVNDAGMTEMSGIFGSSVIVQLIAIILLIAVIIIQNMLSFGYIYLGIRRAEDQPIEFKTIGFVFSIWLLIRMIGVIILTTLCMLVTLLPVFLLQALLYLNIMNDTVTMIVSPICYLITFILAINLAMRISLAQCICIAQKAGPIDSITLSFKATSSNVLRLLGLMILNGLILIVSMIPLGIGLIWSIPYLFINLGLVYKLLVTNQSITA